MKILIVGAGALGSLFGGLLARAGATVQLYNPSNIEHVRAIQKNGLQIERTTGETLRVALSAVAQADEIEPAAVVGIFVKAYRTAAVMSELAPKLSPSAWVLSLQNGVGLEAEILPSVPAERFLRGVTAQGATLVEPGRVRWAGVGPTKIGRWQGPLTPEIAEVIAFCRRAGLETEFVPAIEKLLWEKLLVNSAINPLTALFNVPNGVIVNDSALREIAQAVAREALPVARAHGVLLSEVEAIERIETVACQTAANISSMLQDVRRGRPTEIDYINGTIVREGQRLGKATPLNLLLMRLVAEGHPAEKMEAQ